MATATHPTTHWAGPLNVGFGSLPLGPSDELSPSAQAILGSVYQQSNGPVNFFAAANFLPLSFYGPGTLIDSLSLPMSLDLSGGASSDYVDVDKPRQPLAE